MKCLIELGSGGGEPSCRGVDRQLSVNKIHFSLESDRSVINIRTRPMASCQSPAPIETQSRMTTCITASRRVPLLKTQCNQYCCRLLRGSVKPFPQNVDNSKALLQIHTSLRNGIINNCGFWSLRVKRSVLWVNNAAACEINKFR